MGGMLDSWQQLERWAARHTSGIRGEAKLISARADSLQQAIRLSEGLAIYWILRDFRELDLQGVVSDIVEVLRQCLVVMLTTTGGGALIGGIAGGVGGAGVGAIPGVVVGAGAGAQVGEWILIAMGLKALANGVVMAASAALPAVSSDTPATRAAERFFLIVIVSTPTSMAANLPAWMRQDQELLRTLHSSPPRHGSEKVAIGWLKRSPAADSAAVQGQAAITCATAAVSFLP